MPRIMLLRAGLCERMRSLGCSQVVSMENFRSPNFELVADLLFWLLKRCAPPRLCENARGRSG